MPQIVKMERDVFTPESQQNFNCSAENPSERNSDPNIEEVGDDDLSRSSQHEFEEAEKERVKIRLVAKTQEIAAAKQVLEAFREWLRPSEVVIPEVGDWLEDITAIFEHSDMPRIVVGFMGASGCGKSSAINALLDEEELLPCGCIEATTAVAVEIAYNKDPDPNSAYKAVVQFISAEEWQDELEKIFNEILTLDLSTGLDRSVIDENPAVAKLKALYPEFDLTTVTSNSAACLLNDSVISQFLDKKVEIIEAAGQAKLFSSAIRPYIDSSHKPSKSKSGDSKSPPSWPLVKAVKILTRSEVLKGGLVFVDLPGSGDSNAARAVVTESYMQQIEAICIVADIKRSATESIAKNLHGRGNSLKRRLLRGGLLHEERTFFALTLVDVINNMEVLRVTGNINNPEVVPLLQVQEEKATEMTEGLQRLSVLERRRDQRALTLRRMEETITKLQRSSNESTQQLKRKRDDEKLESVQLNRDSELIKLQQDYQKRITAQDSCNEEIQNLIRKREVLERENQLLEHQLTAVCIKIRNDHVTHRMRMDFSVGLAELEAELEDVGDDDADLVAEAKRTSTLRNGIQVFCICSKAYQKLRKRFGRDAMPCGFDNEDDTSIPDLRKFSKEFTLGAQERLADFFLEDLMRLRQRMRGWADNTRPDKQITNRQRRIIEGKFKTFMSVLKETNAKEIDLIPFRLKENLVQLGLVSLERFAKAAAEKALELFNTWAEDVPSSLTWKAICRKNGKHASRPKFGTAMEYDWNSDLADEFTKRLDKGISVLFNTKMLERQLDHLNIVGNAIDHFSKLLTKTCLGISPHVANSLDNFNYTLQRLKAELDRGIVARFDVAAAAGRLVDQKVPEVIAKVMDEGYVAASRVRGKGCFQVSKACIIAHIHRNGLAMYRDAAKSVHNSVMSVLTTLKTNLADEFLEKAESIEAAFAKMIATATETPRPETSEAKIALQKNVLERLSLFDGLLGQFQQMNGAAEYNDESDKGMFVKEEVWEDDLMSDAISANVGSNANTATSNESTSDGPTIEIIDLDFEHFSDEDDIE